MNGMEIRKEENPLEHEIIMEIAYSTIDGGYVGDLETANYLAERGIAPQKIKDSNSVCSIGFCEKEQKWYGWSHRAIFGFGVGSKVERGDCAYIADTPEKLIEDRYNFFLDISEECAQQHADECQILPDRSGIRILHAPLVIPMAGSVDEAISAIEGDEPEMKMVDINADAVSIVKCGRGEWTAKTLDDAKQMAIDFAESVS